MAFKRQVIQDGADFYERDGGLIARVPDTVKHDFDLEGAGMARIQFLIDHPDCEMSIEDHQYECSVWFERDRANVTLTRPDRSEVFSLWDEDVFEAIQDGFLTTPRLFSLCRGSNKEWHSHAVDYARNQGLIP